MTKQKLLPITLLSGFLGAGKTTLVQHILSQEHSLRIAILVNDMAEVNVDYQLLKQQNIHALRSDDHLIELSNGCICCTLKEELIEEIVSLVTQDAIDYLIIESSGIAEPLPIAELFLGSSEELTQLKDLAYLDTMVTVIDAKEVLPNIRTGEQLADFALARDESDERSISELHLDQIECADVLLINKTDLIMETETQALIALLKLCNPEARIVPTSYGRVDLKEIMHTDYAKNRSLESAPLLQGETHTHHHSESEEYGISSFTFRSRLPFHPERLWTLIHEDLDTVLRSKGIFWIASRPDWIGSWSQAGESMSISTHQRWWAARPESEWPEKGEEARRELDLLWEEPYGDRMNELVFIGQHMDEDRLIHHLEKALLSDTERALSMAAWQEFEDPFPEWYEPQ